MAQSCSAESTGRTVVGPLLTFTFPDMDRQCGDCSLFHASITVARHPNGDWEWEWRATVNSSDTGDRWEQTMTFFRADGSVAFVVPGFWKMGQDIADKDTPQQWIVAASTANHPPLAHEIPADYMTAVKARIDCSC